MKVQNISQSAGRILPSTMKKFTKPVTKNAEKVLVCARDGSPLFYATGALASVLSADAFLSKVKSNDIQLNLSGHQIYHQPADGSDYFKSQRVDDTPEYIPTSSGN